jgi:hypothetical protein
MSGRESSGHEGARGGGAPRQSAAWVDAGGPAEEVRIGDSRLVRGGAKVSAFTEAPEAEEAPRDTAGCSASRRSPRAAFSRNG